MSSNNGTNTAGRSEAPFTFLHRTNNADPRVKERSPNEGDEWEVVDKAEVLENQDKDEWVLVGKTQAEKKKQEEERKAKAQSRKRTKFSQRI